MKSLSRLLIGLVTFFTISLVIIFSWLRSSLPQTQGTITLSGLHQPVTIARDGKGVPHITGANMDDLNFAVGFVHAQDRLWQLDINRRIGNGRLSEVFGPETLNIDKFFRTLGFRDKAAKAYINLPEDGKKTLDAYASGINAFIKSRTGALPPEFVVLGGEMEPWSGVDTLVWLKMMWFNLSGNYRTELARAGMMSKLTPKQVAEYYPTYPGESEEIPLPDMRDMFAQLPLEALAEATYDAVGDAKPSGFGSNNWVISGDKTKSGKPILSNDPHLGLTSPSIWYLVHLNLTTDDTNMVGVTLPGAPTVILGRNDNIAWGFTNTNPDSQDLYIEKLENGGNSYLTPTGIANFKSHVETIKIKGESDVKITIRSSRHGPIISDVVQSAEKVAGDGYAIALKWTALADTDTSVLSGIGIMTATTFDEFKKSARHYMGPEQNMIYGDTKGNIGYYAPAMVPIRHPDNKASGRIPVPGWIAKYDWQGFIDYDELPLRYNPKGGIIATANEKIVDADYPHYITREWGLPYRGNRIRHMLKSSDEHDMSSMKALLGDITSDMARDLSIMLPDQSINHGAILNRLKTWDGTMAMETPEPLIFNTWLKHYSKLVYADELGGFFKNSTRSRPYFLKNIWAAENGSNHDAAYYQLPTKDDASYALWCDDVTTSKITERCSDLTTTAFEMAAGELTAKYGKDWTKWQWGKAHTLRQQHRPFSQVAFLKEYFEVSAPQSGGRFTINVAGDSWSDKALHASSFGPSYRGVFDLSNMENSQFIIPTGQSGNPFSQHFSDQFQDWRDINSFKIPTKDIDKLTSKVLTLMPNKGTVH